MHAGGMTETTRQGSQEAIHHAFRISPGLPSGDYLKVVEEILHIVRRVRPASLEDVVPFSSRIWPRAPWGHALPTFIFIAEVASGKWL